MAGPWCPLVCGLDAHVGLPTRATPHLASSRPWREARRCWQALSPSAPALWHGGGRWGGAALSYRHWLRSDTPAPPSGS